MNIFDNIPNKISEEILEELFSNSNVRIERVVSSGNVSPDNFWYDQDEDEWILLVAGNAIVTFEGDRTVELKAGDTLYIGAHEKHRVAYTSSNPQCIWLCIFMKC